MALKKISLCSEAIFDLEKAQQEIAKIDKLIDDENLWQDADKAAKLMSKRQSLIDKIGKIDSFQQQLTEIIELCTMAEQEGEHEIVNEAVGNLKNLEKTVQKTSLEIMLSAEADENNAYIEIQAGAGGTESQDWCAMLMRMYIRWAEDNSYNIDTVQSHQGEEAGIKSVTLEIKGLNAYGWLKSESGVHRLVRISPFDANARRHTSFASVWVYPVIDDDIEISIGDDEVRIDTYRSSGAGGQHVNTTDSAVRITHLPTSIAVQCQNERSQHKNRARAWNMLRARLYEHNRQQKEAEQQKNQQTKTDIGWGHQIRSYVLQPYRLVKDLRTKIEHSSPDAVLNGDINVFLQASLSQSQKSD